MSTREDFQKFPDHRDYKIFQLHSKGALKDEQEWSTSKARKIHQTEG